MSPLLTLSRLIDRLSEFIGRWVAWLVLFAVLISAANAIDAEVRLYDRLFTEAEPEKDGRDFKTVLNPHSLEVVTAKCEPSLKDATADARYQFERLAYFALDPDSAPGKPVFNRTITLKDAWAKEAQKG